MYYNCQAIVPFYDPYGHNMTYTLLADGTQSTYCFSIKNYIYHMFYQVCLDPVAVRHYSSRILHAKGNLPLLLSPDYIFIPVKMRRPIGRQDGAFGYVRVDAIQSYENGIITLTSGKTLTTYSSDTYIAHKLKDAKLLRYAYSENRILVSVPESSSLRSKKEGAVI